MTTGLPPSVVLAGAFLLLLAGCTEAPEDIANGDDPLKALTVGATSTRYDGPYWMPPAQRRAGALPGRAHLLPDPSGGREAELRARRGYGPIF